MKPRLQPTKTDEAERIVLHIQFTVQNDSKLQSSTQLLNIFGDDLFLMELLNQSSQRKAISQ